MGWAAAPVDFFSPVSSLLNVLNIIIIRLTFEDFYFLACGVLSFFHQSARC